MDMIEAAALLVIIMGLVRPKWVRKKKAFGFAIILLVGCLGIYHLVAGARSPTMRYYEGPWDLQTIVGPCLGVMVMLAQIGYVIALLVAFWPGGDLFGIGEEEADEEGTGAGESESTQE